MPKKKPPASGFVLFNVVYEDGSLSSNRKVPASALGGLDGDEPAYGIIAEQDRNIAAMSGRLPGRIKSLSRVDDRKARSSQKQAEAEKKRRTP